jgi:hypothetical protein
VAFTKVLINYIILEFTPSTAPLYLSSPDSWNSFNRYRFYIYMHVYTFFAPHSFSYPLSPPLPPLHWWQPSSLGRTCSTVLFSDFAEEKKKKEKHDIFASLR